MISLGNIIAGSVLVLIFTITMIVGAINYRSFHKKKYSILNCFPFEFTSMPRMRLNVLMQILYTVLAISFCLFYYNVFRDYQVFIFKLAIGLGMASSIMLLTTFMLKITSDKVHIICSSIFMVLSCASITFIGYCLLQYDIYLVYDALPYILFGLAFFEVLILLNPYLKKWANLITSDDGTLVRPRVFILALSEWLTVIINVLVVILLATGIH